MSIEVRLLLGGLSALVLVLLLTPVAIRIARRLDFVDRPVGYKAHAAPTPYLGGAAVIAAVLVPVIALGASLDATATGALAGATLLLWGIGTVDDRRTVTPTARVIAEIAVGVGLWAADLGWDLGAGAALDIVATAAWLVVVINAVNLFDNLDGAAASVAAAVAAGIAALSLVTGDAWLAALTAATAFSCLGFLRFNLARPARIFLGDGGSMPLGLLVAVAAIVGAGGAAQGVAAPAAAIALVGLPLLDTALVVVSRRRRGISLLVGGRDHLSHRTLSRVGTPRRVAALLASAQLGLSAVAIIATQTSESAIWVVLLAYLAAAGATIAWLERDFPATRAVPPTIPLQGNDRQRGRTSS